MDVRVMIASEVRLYRIGLERLLREIPDVTIVGAASSAEEAYELAGALIHEVMLLDMAMPDAYGIAKRVGRLSPVSKVVALGTPEDEAEVLACAEAGIAGYVTREGSVDDVVAAIRTIARGEVYCSAKVASSLVRRVAERANSAAAAAGGGTEYAAGRSGSLTTREAQILKLMQQGLSNKMISRTLGIELPTVKNHVHNILTKLGIHRRAEAILVGT
jgi:two-component system, NarL family, nitrate/nitrite response regulator NarL